MSLWDRLAERPALWNALRRFLEAGWRGEKAAIHAELRAWQPESGLWLLDFGCGTGELTALFPRERYVGMDISPIYVGYAGRTYGPRFQVMDGAALGYADDAFDEGLVAGVFHHLPDEVVRRMARELARVLRPAGRLLVMEDVPARDWWNLPGRLMHAVDQGSHIRAEHEYLPLFAEYFAPEKTYPMRSGVCDYLVLVLRARHAAPLQGGHVDLGGRAESSYWGA